MGAGTCHPFSFRKERFRSPPPTYCKCHQEMALSCQHSRGFISAGENCLVQGHTSSQSSPHSTTDERGGWAALPVIPTQSIPEGPSQLHGPLRPQPIPMSSRGTLLVRLPNLAPSPSDRPKTVLLKTPCGLVSLRVCSQGIQLVTGRYKLKIHWGTIC